MTRIYYIFIIIFIARINFLLISYSIKHSTADIVAIFAQNLHIVAYGYQQATNDLGNRNSPDA